MGVVLIVIIVYAQGVEELNMRMGRAQGVQELNMRMGHAPGVEGFVAKMQHAQVHLYNKVEDLYTTLPARRK